MKALSVFLVLLLVLLDQSFFREGTAVADEPLLPYAGTGAVGYADGDRLRASFMLPLGIAETADGDIYVADAGAQRIRKISAFGLVTTVAGSGSVGIGSIFVRPGYRDGPAASAQFNRPIAVAIGPDGGIYVADAGNHCIRKILHNRVTTFAGTPSRAVAADGPAAGFADPISLAVDPRNGAVYVADYGGGVRKIDADGNTSTIDVPGVTKQIRAIAVSSLGSDSILFVSADEGFCAFIVEKHEKIGFGQDNDGGETELGRPTQMFSLGDEELVFSDARTRSVKYFSFRLHNTPFRHAYTSSLLGDELAQSATDSKLLRGPFGIGSRDSGAEVVFSDAGLRQIFRISGPDRRRPISDDFSELQRNDKHYRILYVSNSVAFTNVTWPQSPGGVIEDRLAHDGSRLGLTHGVTVTIARIAPSTLSGITDFIENWAADGNFDLVVLAVNGPLIRNEFADLSEASKWQLRLKSTLSSMNAALASSHTALLLVYSPTDADSSFLERNWGVEVSAGLGSSPLDFKAFQQDTDSALRELHVPYLNTYPPFASAERQSIREPMIGTYDGHLSRVGDALLGNLIADRIEQMRPWK